MEGIYIFKEDKIEPAKIERQFGSHGPYTLEGQRLDLLTNAQILVDSSTTKNKVLNTELTVELIFQDGKSQHVLLKELKAYHWILGFVDQTPLSDSELKMEKARAINKKVVDKKNELHKKVAFENKKSYLVTFWVVIIFLIIIFPPSAFYLIVAGILFSFYPKRVFISLGLFLLVALLILFINLEDSKTIANNSKRKKMPADTEKSKGQAENKFDNKVRTKEILSLLKKIPVSEYKENSDLYRELVTLNPDIMKYKEKLDFYAEKERKEIERNREAQSYPERFLKIEKFSWKKDLYSASASFNIRNTAPRAVKDIEFYCKFYAKSGTSLGGKKYIIYDIVAANNTKRFRNIDLGIIPAQTSNGGCAVFLAKPK